MRVNKWPWLSVWGGRVSKGRVTQRTDCILGGTPGKSLKLVRCYLVFFFFFEQTQEIVKDEGAGVLQFVRSQGIAHDLGIK